VYDSCVCGLDTSQASSSSSAVTSLDHDDVKQAVVSSKVQEVLVQACVHERQSVITDAREAALMSNTLSEIFSLLMQVTLCDPVWQATPCRFGT